MNVCTEETYTCGDKKEAIAKGEDIFAIRQVADVTFTFNASAVSFPIRKRKRDMTYLDSKGMDISDIRYVFVDGSYILCGTPKTVTPKATIGDTYEALDVSFLYADLRYDLFVYEESVQSMAYDAEQEQQVMVDFTWKFPFIFTEVPIQKHNRIICTGLSSDLENVSYATQYADNIYLLMPSYDGKVPNHNLIVIDGILYDAYDVPWYNLREHLYTDGDMSLWWPDWHKVVGKNHGVDEREALLMGESYIGERPTPHDYPVLNSLVTAEFNGSAAKDIYGNFFFSAQIEGAHGIFKVNRLINEDGTEAVIPPTEGAATWYPIAPL